MGADANIFQQYLKPVKSVADYSAERDAATDRKNAAQMNALQLSAMTQKTERDNAFRTLVSTAPADPAERVKALRASGNLEAMQHADALEKNQLDMGKVRADTGKATADANSKTLEAKIKAHDFSLQQLQGVNDPESAHLWAISELKNGSVTPEQFMQGVAKIPSDPAQFQAWKKAAMQSGVSVLDNMRIENENARAKLSADTSIANNTATNATSRANNAASNSVSMRGQNMTDARTREATAATVGKPFEVTGPDGVPVLVQQDKQGNITPVQGYQPKTVAEKPLNDSQSKALLFGSRMREANNLLKTLEAEGASSSIPGSSAPVIGGVINALSPANQQALDQAKRDFMTAILRRESGAAISSGEYDTADKQYFPQIGDSKKVRAQKAANRELAMNGVLMEVPEKQRQSLQPTAPQQPAKTQGGSSVSNW